jgi:ribosomal protein L11 methyltransferase
MNETYLDILLSVPNDDSLRETLAYQLHQLGFEGVMEDQDGVHAYILRDRWGDSIQSSMQAVWNTHSPHSVAISSITEIKNQNWNLQWEESIQPIAVTERIVITPSWHPLPDQKQKTVLIIDPKMSFGTGYHESTRLVIRLLEQYLIANSTVLDVGTGTGILAIAAVKLGARFAIGVDVDEWSYVNGRENVERNELVKHVDIRHGSLDVVQEREFNMILANITRNAIIELLPAMLEKLQKDGLLLLSGLMADDRTAMEKMLQLHRCTVLSVINENEWIGIAARRG